MEKKLWAITTFFNPIGYKNKKEHYSLFRDCLKTQGCPLLCVELALGDGKYELNEQDADMLVQVRSDSIMWHKERLLNIALSKLPDNCDKFAWLDADVIFLDPEWVEKAEKLLDKHEVAQLFKQVAKVEADSNWKGLSEETALQTLTEWKSGSIYSHLNEGQDLSEAQKQTGFAWGARRSLFDDVGFFDKFIIGGGDVLLLNGFTSSLVWKTLKKRYSSEDELNNWIRTINSRISLGCGYLDTNILTFIHGSANNRMYQLRHKYLGLSNIDIDKELYLNDDNCYEIRSPELNRKLRQYFLYRNEDHSSMREMFLVFTNFDFFRHLYGSRWSYFRRKILGTLKKVSPKSYDVSQICYRQSVYFLKRLFKKNSNKVFGIGFGRTGTSSLKKCLQALGYNCFGFSAKLVQDIVVKKDFNEVFKIVENFDAFEDSPFFLIYKELDKQFPGSKFILTLRKDSETWLKSYKKRCLINHTVKLPHRLWSYGYESPLGFEKEHVDLYEKHILDVKEHFKDRPNQLLIVCWEKGHGWKEVCEYLGKPVPEKEFPFVNASPEVAEDLLQEHNSRQKK